MSGISSVILLSDRLDNIRSIVEELSLDNLKMLSDNVYEFSYKDFTNVFCIKFYREESIHNMNPGLDEDDWERIVKTCDYKVKCVIDILSMSRNPINISFIQSIVYKIATIVEQISVVNDKEDVLSEDKYINDLISNVKGTDIILLPSSAIKYMLDNKIYILGIN